MVLMSNSKGQTERRNLQIDARSKVYRHSMANPLIDKDIQGAQAVSFRDAFAEVIKATEKCINCATMRMSSLGENPNTIALCELHSLLLDKKTKVANK